MYLHHFRGFLRALPILRAGPVPVAAEVRAQRADTGGLGVMIGPGCSISPDTPEATLAAAIQAVVEWAEKWVFDSRR
jgi:uroporphyrinogen-III decarboxylase